MLVNFYKTLINNAKAVFFATLFVCIGLSFFASKLGIDASAETLLLDDDKDLEFFRQVSKDYQSDDFLILAIKPKDNDPFSNESLALLKALQSELESIKGVRGILSILNAPLLKSSDNATFQDLLKRVPTLTSVDTNLTKARVEIAHSPFYQNNIISKDANNTAFVIYLNNELYDNLISATEQNASTEQIAVYQDKLKKENKERLKRIKAVIAKFTPQTNGLYLGGVSMIADDMISYIKDDLLVYGVSLTLLLSFVLWLFFRQIYLVLFTLFTCVSALGAASGIFALLGFKITVISSNYLALMLIITISLIIHLITYFINLCKQFPKANVRYKVLATLLAKSRPSFYAILTTAIGFLSLVLSKIEPVIKLGIMMSIGISVSLVLSFLFFASIVPSFKRLHFENKTSFKINLLNFCANLSLKYPKIIYAISVLCVVVSLFGIEKLRVENSFVNYFKDSSDIKKGLVVIDEDFGGTLPLELIISFLDKNESKSEALDSFESEFQALSEEKTYWFNAQKTRIAQNIHEYLQKKEFVGSVLSLNSLLLLAKDINDGQDLDDFALAFLNENLPDEFKQSLLNAYVNIDKNQLRFVMRIKDSNPNLKRDEFIKEIQRDLSTLMKDENVQIRLSGLMLLYNNMLQSLFASQFNTLVFVVATIFLLFVFVFRSVKYAFVGITANVVPLSLVFALMGFSGLPLDLMSITIAAICIGLGVDDSIHYIYNFKKELSANKGVIRAIKLSHFQVGQAFFQSKIAIILGFSVMMSSNFTPTIYFGFLTVLVMVLLLLGSLLLLPSLLASNISTKKA